MKNFKISILFFVIIFIGGISQTALGATKCVNLTKTLGLGMTSKTTGGEVTTLQNYLISAGYLPATSVGRYGLQTAAAVKKLQKANKISQTGSVGVLTRAAIKKATCLAGVAVSSTAADNAAMIAAVTQALQVVPSPALVPATPDKLVTSPASDDVWTIGQKRSIEWTNSDAWSYRIVLEDADGIGVGHVISSLASIDHYNWKVGEVSVADSSDDVLVAPGQYRLRVIGLRTYNPRREYVDQVSDYFKIAEVPLRIRRIEPDEVQADDRTSVVLNGSGFTEQTKVFVDNNEGVVSIAPSYRSADGKVLVFTSPSYLKAGSHSVHVLNEYSTENSTSTPSNSVELIVSD